MMANVSKDIVDMIYRLLHNDNIKALNAQYNSSCTTHYYDNGNISALNLRRKNNTIQAFNYRKVYIHRNPYLAYFNIIPNPDTKAVFTAPLSKNY